MPLCSTSINAAVSSLRIKLRAMFGASHGETLVGTVNTEVTETTQACKRVKESQHIFFFFAARTFDSAAFTGFSWPQQLRNFPLEINGLCGRARRQKYMLLYLATWLNELLPWLQQLTMPTCLACLQQMAWYYPNLRYLGHFHHGHSFNTGKLCSCGD